MTKRKITDQGLAAEPTSRQSVRARRRRQADDRQRMFAQWSAGQFPWHD